jgi:hypothetical protein
VVVLVVLVVVTMIVVAVVLMVVVVTMVMLVVMTMIRMQNPKIKTFKILCSAQRNNLEVPGVNNTYETALKIRLYLKRTPDPVN